MTSTHTDYSEKRDFIRMKVDAGVSLIHAGQVVAATCLDLSSSGMQIQSPRQFKVGDKLEVHIDSEHPALKGLQASTEVVWIADQPQGQQKLGLRIITLI
ncbi:PilZ domain-containing protein [Pseudomonas sp. GD03860]|uniref:PilZ domain-containing protein n=1 Tax=Pseudomonas TaxID=286 RepID=UPI0023637DEC|nr:MULTISPECIES: PilZ domain-containing protein [Pseudomonas]MDD2056229.1 PilZ domain-containing protein [Pseudomonas putida]MDH0637340.1 PilZ domain-containing protein [Pseudomonas sp. GD03860]